MITRSFGQQGGVVLGEVRDATNNTPIEFVNIFLPQVGLGAVSDEEGKYRIENVPQGIYTIEASFIGYESVKQSEIEVGTTRPLMLNFALFPNAENLDEVVVAAGAFRSVSESPLSLRNIGISEIKRNPGGNRDISLVIRSFPGVTSVTSFRNDLIIRGGSPNENRFYLDDVEIPNINHFSTQGASGGPASILNVDFIKEVDFYSGAFPADRNNSLSSIFNFRQLDGRADRLGMTMTLGASDVGVTLEGPLTKSTSFLFSARRSYLQFLFGALGLPFLPTYNDFNVKVKSRLSKNSELSFIGIGAIDNFKLNLDANETEEQRYNLGRLPVNEQWNYTNGLVYKRFYQDGYANFIISRNMINFRAHKYLNNDDSLDENLILDYQSQEIENHLRVEKVKYLESWKLSYGGRYDYVKYNINTYNKIYTQSGSQEVDFENALAFHKFGAFAQVSKRFLKNRLDLSLGLQLEGNTYSEEMKLPWRQFSPRFSASYTLDDRWKVNLNTGCYTQLPPYTVLGYKENGQWVNRDGGVDYIRSTHFVAGIEYQTAFESRWTLEGYYKIYSQYPLLLREGISMANVGGDYGVIGNEPVISTSDGRTYGVELFYQQRLYKGLYGMAAYTLGWSEFSNRGLDYAPSSWDARHIVSMTMGIQLPRKWELGTKWRYQSGLPYSPFHPDSDLVVNWEANGQAIPDYSMINTLRNEASSSLDVRIDKKWGFSKWEINLYFDVQNVLGSSVRRKVMLLDVALDANGTPIGVPEIIDPSLPKEEQRYRTKIIESTTGTVLPTIGLIIKI